MKVIFSNPAKADLLDVLAYIAQDNVTVALEIVDDIERFCRDILPQNPEIGTVFEASIPDIRRFPKQTYNIFYRFNPTQIEIVRILHHSRLAKHILS